ncbi:MAG: hypothetical protein SH856_12415 [Flavobacteriales bacterium]|nr:hypothetical protein [Flavobacteriales bacterium]
MEEDACNYNPDAACDDGSCTYPGCNNPLACNFNSDSGCNNGTCVFPGCTDPTACGYNPLAGCDDGSCSGIPGCTNPEACNFDALAACTDGSCTFPGCTDEAACNYDPNAGCDDGSCGFGTQGCTNPLACNFDPGAGCDDGSCQPDGCTDPGACNYDPLAYCDDGDCSSSVINGYVFNDANGNGLWQQGGFDEPGMFNRQVLLEPLGLIVFTDVNGYFQFNNVAAGVYNVTVIDNDDVWESSTPSTVNITMPGCFTVNFGLTPTDNTAFWLQGPCCIWSMNIHCTNGINPGLWVHNTGPVALQGQVTVGHNTAMTAVPVGGITVNPSSIVPGLVTWGFDNQLSGQSKLYQCHLNGPGVDYIGQVLPINITLTLWDDNDVVFYENTWTLTPTVVCAYDPNDKYAEPMGYTEENHFILNGTDIEYRIRFQNTGNFVAEDVMVSDQLDLSALDITTFEPLYGSANYMACLHLEGMVDFMFNEIMLPDSATDQPGSQGFVVFRISTLPGLDAGTIINNTAAIIFDDNPPIITNTMWHTIYECDGMAEISSSGSPVCFGETVTLNATEEFMESTEWFEGEILVNEEGEFVPAFPSDGTFEFALYTANPICEEDGLIEIVVNPLPEIDAGPDVDVCMGESVLLNATGTDEILWSNASENNSYYTPSSNEILTAGGENEFGCYDSDDITITLHPLPGIEVTQKWCGVHRSRWLFMAVVQHRWSNRRSNIANIYC